MQQISNSEILSNARGQISSVWLQIQNPLLMMKLEKIQKLQLLITYFLPKLINVKLFFFRKKISFIC